MKYFIVIFALLASVLAHSYLTVPPARTGIAGITAPYCGAAAPANVNYTSDRVTQAGRRLVIEWCTCSHNGINQVSLSLRPRADDFSTIDFTNGLLSDPYGYSTFDLETGVAELQVPSTTTPGEYTVIWNWADTYYSCTDVRIDANDGKTWCYRTDDCNYNFSIYGERGGICNQTDHSCYCFPGFSGQLCENEVLNAESSLSSMNTAFVLVASFALVIAALMF